MPSSAPYLHRSAYSRRRRRAVPVHGRYEVSGSLDVSRVAGDAAAIALTQRDPVHLYQRPDGPLDFDSTRTSLAAPTRSSGSPRSAASGSTSRPPTSGARPGFEINDIGFLRQADQQAVDELGQPGLQPAQPDLPAAPLELQQLGVLDQRGAADRAGLQHQRAHPVHQPVVAAHGRHPRPARRHLLRSLRAGGPAIRQDPVPLALDRRSRATTGTRWCRSCR